THGVDYEVGAEAPGQRADRLNRVLRARVHRMRRTESLGLFELRIVDIDGDNGRRTSELSARYRGCTHATATDDRDRFTPLHRAGVDRSADAGHYTAPEQPNGRRVRFLIDLRALPRGDESLLDEGTDAECCRQ